MTYDKFKLEEFGGYIELNRPWANLLDEIYPVKSHHNKEQI